VGSLGQGPPFGEWRRKETANVGLGKGESEGRKEQVVAESSISGQEKECEGNSSEVLREKVKSLSRSAVLFRAPSRKCDRRKYNNKNHHN
jgi:hypothetical protein